MHDVNELISAIRSFGDVSLIIVDSVLSTREEYSEGMETYIQNCKKIQDQTGASILLIHYERLPGVWDIRFEVERDKDVRSVKIIRPGWFDNQKFQFNLDIVSIGEDEYGEDITSCVVNWS